MGQTQRQTSEQWDRLEAAVLQWQSSSQQHPADRIRLNTEITEIMLELFPQPEALEALGVFWERDMGRYDPQKGNFRSFVTSRLKLRRQDMEYEDFGVHRAAGGESGQRRVRNLSLDTPLDEDGEGTLADQQAAPNADAGQAELEAEAAAQELIALILSLPERLHGQAKNPARINYYRMFFTDGTVAALHTVGGRPYVAHERDLFASMKLPFLDFFMDRTCRRVSDLIEADLKPYGQMVEGRPMESPDQPLPNDVYMEYLNVQEGMDVKSPSTITNQRVAYRAFLRENLC